MPSLQKEDSILRFFLILILGLKVFTLLQCCSKAYYFCFACTEDMPGVAWICGYDRAGNPEPCFGEIHKKKEHATEVRTVEMQKSKVDSCS